ncbi:MAG TPA: PIN domain-containing protein [Chloroflexia bacterium]|jgi:predicted nucleic acid-binding protein
MKLDVALSGATRLGLDTSAIIYFIEAHPKYDTLITAIFNDIATGRFVGVTSAITLTEVLIQPLLHDDTQLQQRYRDLLLWSDNFEVVSVDAAVAERAANIRARYRLRTPDALQIATALNANCQVFITNDATLHRVSELRVLLLDELKP